MEWDFLHQNTEDPGTTPGRAHHGHIVGAPWLQYSGFLLPHGLLQREKGDTVKEHQDGISLSKPLSDPQEAE